MKPHAESQLYTFIDTAYLRGRSPVEIARQLCMGGSDLIQLRAKNEPMESIRRMAEGILPVTRAAGIPLVINPDAHSEGELALYEYGVDVARRGWLEKGDVFNTRTVKEVVRELERRRA